MNQSLAVHRVAGEFRAIWKSIDDLNRRAAATFLQGKVHEIDGDYVRLELAPPDGRGKRFLSPKVKVQEMAGKSASRFPVKLGDPMRLCSPNGEIGSQSLAIRDAWTDDAPPPGDEDEMVIAFGDASIRVKGGAMRIVADSIAHESDSLTHNGRNVGADHKHQGVEPGPALTGDPA